jgi:hypothetical protein
MAAESTDDDDLAAEAVTGEAAAAMTTAMAAMAPMTTSRHDLATAVMTVMPEADMTAMVMRASEAMHKAVPGVAVESTMPMCMFGTVPVAVAMTVPDQSTARPVAGPGSRSVTTTEAVTMMGPAGHSNCDRTRKDVAVVMMLRMTARSDDDANGASAGPRMSAADDCGRYRLDSRSDHTMATGEGSRLAVAATTR